MKEQATFDVVITNCGSTVPVTLGTPLIEIAEKYCNTVTDPKTGEVLPVIAALVDHKLKELSYCVSVMSEIEFIGYNDGNGRRTYARSLCFLLQKAVRDILPDKVLIIGHSLPSGMYCTILDEPHGATYKITDEEIEMLQKRMEELVAADLPFGKEYVQASMAKELFLSQKQPDKAELIESIGKYTSKLYSLDGYRDSFYGPLVPSTKYLTKFALSPFSEGFCLKMPMMDNFSKLLPMNRQSKISDTLSEYAQWCSIVHINGLGTLNRGIRSGYANLIINVAEALHSRKYAAITDEIKARGANIVFIAGPSSSGKTSTSLRIALQCCVLGLNPKVIELDNYFLDREQTPRDENGEYDFESLYAMDLKLLGENILDLLAGKEVVIPKFDFKTGSRVAGGGTPMRLGPKDILIMEGIHALNPEMVPGVPQDKIFRVYASALTSLYMDENNTISTSDNRLLRRMIRDNRVRGISPEETILRWASVRRGEAKNIFPFQENADAIFNTALIFELPLLKYYAEPLLRRIRPDSPAYTEAVRMLNFLNYIVALTPEEIAAVPPTSIMREFIGGQMLTR